MAKPMHTPSSKYLSRQPVILKGLNLNELCFVVGMGIGTGGLTGAICGVFIGFIVIFMICGVLLGGFVGYFVFSKVLVRFKDNAPAGFLKKKMVIKVSKYGLIQNPYHHYEGVWLKSRKIKG